MPLIEGQTHEPFFIEPAFYHLMAYPVEWIYEGSFNDKLMRENLPMFYIRNWGRAMVVSLPTLIYDDMLSEWFVEDPCGGLRALMKARSDVKVFPSDCYAMVQEGRLKFMDVAMNVKVGNYRICPLIPVKLEPPRVIKMSLGIPFPAEQASAELRMAQN
jgi:hypothetical protein